MESTDYLESKYGPGEDKTAASLDTSQTVVFFSILCVLLKSEAIFTFFVYWLRGLALRSGTVTLPSEDTFTHIWLLKPLFSLLIDKLYVPVSQKERSLEDGANVPESVPYSASTTSLFRISNYRVAFLVAVEYVLAGSSVILYLLYYFNCFHTYCTNLVAYSLALALVCASSYAEGMFSTYVRSRGIKTYVTSISLRLMLSALYGFSTLVCLFFPVIFRNNAVGKFFQINLFFPLFLTFNAVFVSWLLTRPVVKHENPESAFSPVAAPVDNGRPPMSNTFSLECLVSLMVMMLLSLRLKNDFFNQYNNTKADNYVFILLTNFFKFVSSLMIYYFMGPKGMMRLCMAVFGASMLLLYPLQTYAALLFSKMLKLDQWQVLVAGFFMSYAQQLILTYGLFTSLLNTPYGYEASVLSMPTFVAHLAHLCLRQHIIDYVDLSKNQRWMFQLLGLFIFLYCYTVLIKVNQGNWMKLRATANREKRPEEL